MEEVLKNILYYSVLSFGGASLICLLIAGLIRSFCLMLDHIKAVNVLREALQLYIKTKNERKLTEEDIIK
jgi:hypothetical protein